MPRISLPEDWTPEQADAVADFLYSTYLQLMDALVEQYPAATQPYRRYRRQGVRYTNDDTEDDSDS